MRTLVRLVRRQGQIGQHASKKKIAALLLIQQQRVFTAPPQTGQFGKFAFHQRCRINDTAGLSTFDRIANRPAQLLEFRMDQIMIIVAAPNVPAMRPTPSSVSGVAPASYG